jgi:hypothetical protein
MYRRIRTYQNAKPTRGIQMRLSEERKSFDAILYAALMRQFYRTVEGGARMPMAKLVGAGMFRSWPVLAACHPCNTSARNRRPTRKKFNMVRRVIPAVVVAALSTLHGQAKPPAHLSANIGKNACNATNGVYVGRVVDVVNYSPQGQAASWVYVVDREGRRMNRPPDNTTIAVRCPDGQPTPASLPPPPPPPRSISPAMKGAAAEFDRRLNTYKGRLSKFEADDKVIRVEWSSQRCDMLEGEIIDLMLSLKRGHPGSVKQNIEATRHCEGSIKMFRTTGATFESYRAGKINDVALLRGIR